MDNNAPTGLLDARELSSDEMKKAFNEIVTKDGIVNPHKDELEIPFEQPEHTTTELDAPTGNPQESSPQDEIVSDTPKRGRPPKDKQAEVDTSALNFEEEYKQLKEKSDAHIGLLTSRINELSSQYQELKSTATTKKEESTIEYPDNVKEAFELFPELQDAVSFLIDSKVGKVVEQIQPIKQYADSAAQKDALAPIYQAHPDVEQIVNSGALDVWANSLPAIQRKGAFAIINHGSPEEVVELLNDYKKSKGIDSHEQTPIAPRAQLQSSTQKQTTQGYTQSQGVTETNSEANIVNKVLAALNVPSTREPIQVNNNPTQREMSFDEAVKELENKRQAKRGW